MKKYKPLKCFYFTGNSSVSRTMISCFITYSEAEALSRRLSKRYRFYLILIPFLDKVFVKDPDIFKDINTHYFKGIKCLFDDYPFLNEVLRYEKKTN